MAYNERSYQEGAGFDADKYMNAINTVLYETVIRGGGAVDLLLKMSNFSGVSSAMNGMTPDPSSRKVYMTQNFGSEPPPDMTNLKSGNPVIVMHSRERASNRKYIKINLPSTWDFHQFNPVDHSSYGINSTNTAFALQNPINFTGEGDAATQPRVGWSFDYGLIHTKFQSPNKVTESFGEVEDWLEGYLNSMMDKQGQFYLELITRLLSGQEKDWEDPGYAIDGDHWLLKSSNDKVNPIQAPAELNLFVATQERSFLKNAGFRTSDNKKRIVRPAARLFYAMQQTDGNNQMNAEGELPLHNLDQIVQYANAMFYGKMPLKINFRNAKGEMVSKRLSAVCSVPEPIFQNIIGSVGSQRTNYTYKSGSQTEIDYTETNVPPRQNYDIMERVGYEASAAYNMPNSYCYRGILFLPTSVYQAWGYGDVMAFDNGKLQAEYFSFKKGSPSAAQTVTEDTNKNLVISSTAAVNTAQDLAGGTSVRNAVEVSVGNALEGRKLYQLTFISAEAFAFGFRQVKPKAMNIAQTYHPDTGAPMDMKAVNQDIYANFFVPCSIWHGNQRVPYIDDYTFIWEHGTKKIQYQVMQKSTNQLRNFDRGLNHLLILS